MRKLCAIVLLLTLSPLTGAAEVSYFLKIEGIDGEATSKGWEKQIDVVSFAWFISNTASQAGGNGGGKVNINDITITKTCDKASPKLMLSCANGQHIKEAVLTARKNGRRGESDVYVRYTLQDVIITGYSVKGTATAVTEELLLSFVLLKVDILDAESIEFDLSEGPGA